MSDMVRAWLDHTQQLDQAATEGPWEASHRNPDDPLDATIIDAEACNGMWIATSEDDSKERENAEWIVHARTALPKAAAAILAVLDQHQQADYQRHVPRMLRRTPEDHLPYRPCDGCREEWPCPTVKAITDALTSHQHPTPSGSSGKCDHEARGVTWAEGNTTAYVCETCEHEWTETHD